MNPMECRKGFESKGRNTSRGIQCAAELIDWDNRSWKLNLFNVMRDAIMVEEVLRVELPRLDLEDKLLWIGNKIGIWKLKSCHNVS